MSNEEVFLNSYILLLKSTVEVYVHGTLESSNKKVRNLLKSSLDVIMSMQYDTYNKMTELGFYKIQNIDKSIICKTINKLEA